MLWGQLTQTVFDRLSHDAPVGRIRDRLTTDTAGHYSMVPVFGKGGADPSNWPSIFGQRSVNGNVGEVDQAVIAMKIEGCTIRIGAVCTIDMGVGVDNAAIAAKATV